MSDHETPSPAQDPKSPAGSSASDWYEQEFNLREGQLRLEILKFAASQLPAKTPLLKFAAQLADFVFFGNIRDDEDDNVNPFHGHN